MKLSIISHCVLDTIVIGSSQYEQVGGPPCYCGLTAKKFRFDVDLFTKFGSDFPYQDYLVKNKILFQNSISNLPTTRFKIIIHNSDRTLYLENKCEPIEYHDFDSDGTLISPVFDEISKETFEKIKKNSKFVFLDPQGFLRRIDSQKKIFLSNTELNFSNISSIKVNQEELPHLVGTSDIAGLKILQQKGINYVLFTNKVEISMLDRDRIYSLTLPNKQVYDTTGVGDIFSATFCATFLKEKDSLWAFCFAGGAAQSALESKEVGLNKIPEKGEVETNASYFYNMVKFKQV